MADFCAQPFLAREDCHLRSFPTPQLDPTSGYDADQAWQFSSDYENKGSYKAKAEIDGHALRCPSERFP